MTVAYTLTGSGGDIPPEPRKFNDRKDELVQLYHQWLNIFHETTPVDMESMHAEAVRLFSTVRLTVADVNGFMLHPAMAHAKTIDKAVFASAAYDVAPEPVISLPYDPDWFLGYKSKKIFVNNHHSPELFGHSAAAGMVNRGTVATSIMAKELIINVGTTSYSNTEANGCYITPGVLIIDVTRAPMKAPFPVDSEFYIIGQEQKSWVYACANSSEVKRKCITGEDKDFLETIVNIARDDPERLAEYGTAREIKDEFLRRLA